MPTLALAIDAAKMRSGAREAVEATKTVQTGAQTAVTSVKTLQTSMNSLGTASTGLGSKFKGMIASLGGLLILKDAVRVITDFQTTLLELRAVLNATDKEFLRLSDTAKLYGATTKFTAAQSASALLDLGKAGLNVEAAIGTLPGVLSLANAAMLDLERSSEILVNVMAQFKLGAEESVRITDVLVKAANSGSVSVNELAESLKFVGPVASAMGQDLEGTVAALTVLADSGIRGAAGGTNLRQLLSQLIDPSKEARAVLQGLGIDLAEINPVTKSYIEIFQRLKDANLDATDAVTVFTTKTAASALSLVSNTDKLRDYDTKTRDAAGSSQELANVMGSGLAGAIFTFKSAVENLFLTIGDTGLGLALQKTISFLTEIISVLGGSAEAMEKASASAKVLAETLKLLAVFAGAFVAAKLAVAFGGMVASMAALATGTTALTAVMAVNPLFLPAVLASATVAIFGFSGGLSDLSSVGDNLMSTLKTLGSFIIGPFKIGWELIKDSISAIGETFDFVRNSINQGKPDLEILTGSFGLLFRITDAGVSGLEKMRDLLLNIISIPVAPLIELVKYALSDYDPTTTDSYKQTARMVEEMEAEVTVRQNREDAMMKERIAAEDLSAALVTLASVQFKLAEANRTGDFAGAQAAFTQQASIVDQIIQDSLTRRPGSTLKFSGKDLETLIGGDTELAKKAFGARGTFEGLKTFTDTITRLRFGVDENGKASADFDKATASANVEAYIKSQGGLPLFGFNSDKVTIGNDPSTKEFFNQLKDLQTKRSNESQATSLIEQLKSDILFERSLVGKTNDEAQIEEALRSIGGRLKDVPLRDTILDKLREELNVNVKIKKQEEERVELLERQRKGREAVAEQIRRLEQDVELSKVPEQFREVERFLASLKQAGQVTVEEELRVRDLFDQRKKAESKTARLDTSPAPLIETSSRFTGAAQAFQSQSRPLQNIETNTKQAAEHLKQIVLKMATAATGGLFQFAPAD